MICIDEIHTPIVAPKFTVIFQISPKNYSTYFGMQFGSGPYVSVYVMSCAWCMFPFNRSRLICTFVCLFCPNLFHFTWCCIIYWMDRSKSVMCIAMCHFWSHFIISIRFDHRVNVSKVMKRMKERHWVKERERERNS